MVGTPAFGRVRGWAEKLEKPPAGTLTPLISRTLSLVGATVARYYGGMKHEQLVELVERAAKAERLALALSLSITINVALALSVAVVGLALI